MMPAAWDSFPPVKYPSILSACIGVMFDKLEWTLNCETINQTRRYRHRMRKDSMSRFLGSFSNYFERLRFISPQQHIKSLTENALKMLKFAKQRDWLALFNRGWLIVVPRLGLGWRKRWEHRAK